MQGGNVAVVGGSIAGCAVALAAARGGADKVSVLERTTGELRSRGVGIAIQSDRFTELESAGYVHEDMPWRRMNRRDWVVRDGESARGRTIAEQAPFNFRAYNWGSLWNELRRRVPEDIDYRSGTAVTSVEPEADGVVLGLTDGRKERFDIVIGADGYRSLIRDTMFPDLSPGYAGYLGWRGTSPGALTESGSTELSEAATVVGFPGGHCMIYTIPDASGGHRTNWVLYTVPPGDATDGPQGPPAELTPELTESLRSLVAKHFPPYWAQAVLDTPPDETLMQPIYDLEVPHYATGRLLLAGDAATVVRPHVGGGAVKALQDALVLERAWHSGNTWDEVLAAYERDRTAVGSAMVGLARRLGRHQVERTPDWASMGQPEFDAWWREQNQGSDRNSGFGGHALRRGD
ncbi:6-hydroxynicotinate 3-monooxygenase precursor [Streptomyces sp. YIM 130001]|uniref:FAD-dependent monooxygenase n=1 Tax=Streptomyces sp. YIM 130001 TaxID=2259644 RepID=UPI000E658991|nr:FAD-dependent monooxygenase [Streptomyces sp. YIM 130001]RII13888.1 6-hydroxynicotinate 3-monooxygenase precursor [Streptomyces sp. YIM 130001]